MCFRSLARRRWWRRRWRRRWIIVSEPNRLMASSTDRKYFMLSGLTRTFSANFLFPVDALSRFLRTSESRSLGSCRWVFTLGVSVVSKYRGSVVGLRCVCDNAVSGDLFPSVTALQRTIVRVAIRCPRSVRKRRMSCDADSLDCSDAERANRAAVSFNDNTRHWPLDVLPSLSSTSVPPGDSLPRSLMCTSASP